MCFIAEAYAAAQWQKGFLDWRCIAPEILFTLAKNLRPLSVFSWSPKSF